jgi:diguanylate cyclase (GGDEF)-like protein/PAS domain S-box-containing protein
MEFSGHLRDGSDLIENAVVGIFRSVPEGHFLMINRTLAGLCGYDSPEQMLREVRDIPRQLYADPSRREIVMDRLEREDRLVQAEVDLRRRDGSLFIARVSFRAVRDEARRLLRIEGFVEDITEQRRILRIAEERRREMEALLDALPDALLIFDAEGRHVYARPGGDVDLCLPPHAVLGRTVEEVLPPHLAEGVRAALEGVRADGKYRRFEYVLTIDGRLRFCEAVFSLLSPGRVLCLVHDLTQVREIEGKFDLARTIIAHVREGVLVTDPSGTIEQVNGAFEEITGYTAEEVLGSNPRIRKADRQSVNFYQEMWADVWEKLLSRGEWHGEIRSRRKNGEVYPEWLAVQEVRSASGELLHYIGVFTDLTEIKEKDALLQHRTYHDGLTGLPNRALVRDRLRIELRAPSREGKRVALILLDLDRFKILNGTFGYPAGDQVLIEAGHRLRSACGESVTVGRLGEDGYAVVLSDLDSPAQAGGPARAILEELRRPLLLGENTVYLSASLGIAVYPDDGESAEDLFRKADNALYRAKSRGGGTYAFASEELNAQFSRKLHLENGLRRALMKEELQLHYQPIVEIRTGRIAALEALLRWPVPDGFVPPSEFIPLAEETGLILPLGEDVLRRVCRQIVGWQAEGIPPVPVSVNVSAVQVADLRFYETVRGILAETGVDPSALTLEITEQSLMLDRERTKTLFRSLKALGVSVYIDDFGTGYSSLAYLKDFAFDGLKIDRSFIADLTRNPRDAALVEAVLNLARSLGLGVVVEGVEEEQQLRILDGMGASLVQGYCYSRPLPPEQILRRLRRGRYSDPFTCPFES